MDCLVRNLSPSGAHLVFSEPVVIAVPFELDIPYQAQRRQVRIVWRHGCEAGVAFLTDPSADVVSFDAAYRIKTLEAERNLLQRRLAELQGFAYAISLSGADRKACCPASVA